MPQAGVSVPRGDWHRGDRWADDLEVELPRRARRGRDREDDAPRDTPHRLDDASPRLYDVELDPPRRRRLASARDRATVAELDRELERTLAQWSEPRRDLATAPAPVRAADTRASVATIAVDEPLAATTARLADPPARGIAPPGATPFVDSPDPEPGGRRTIIINGRPGERRTARRPQVSPHRRTGFQPDRIAMWAVLLGLVLLLVAATSSHAAVLVHLAH
jgi:hypothetical protein